MPKRYFDKFPTIDYNGFVVKDITVSAKLVDKFVNLPYNYRLYNNTKNERPDQISDTVYSDSYMSWMVFYANKIIDPYYDWLLSDDNFNKFLIKKYGSFEYTHKKIMYYRMNWHADNRELSPQDFKNLFGEYTFPHSKYWDPEITDSGRILGYHRKETDNIINTNVVIRIGVSNNEIKYGELIDVKETLNGPIIGTGEVTFANSSIMVLEKFSGNIANSNYILSDANNKVYTQITNYSPSDANSDGYFTIKNISDEEMIYWEPHTVFEYEVEKNFGYKSIKIVDGTTANKIADRLEEELNG